MRRLVIAAVLSIATGLGALTPALGACTFACPVPPPAATGPWITPLGGFVLGSVAIAAVAPMIGTIIAGRELTLNEVYRLELTTFLGPVGWWLGNRYFPDTPGGGNPPTTNPPARGRNINIPPAGETHFVPNEVLVEFDAGTSARYLDALSRNLQMMPQETYRFALTGRTLQRWRIDGTRSVPNTLRALKRYARVSAGQANFTHLGQQGAPASTQAADAGAA